MKKRKSIFILLIVLLMFTFLVCSVAFAANISDSDNFALENGGNSIYDLSVSSAEQTKKTAYKFLDDNMIDYSSVEIEDGVLIVTLNSQGDGSVTLKDAQSILHVYEFIHTLDSSSNVNDIQLYIYDASGKKIYDLFETDVRTYRVCTDEILNNSEMELNFASTDNIISTAKFMVAEYCDADIESMKMQESPALTGDCLTMVISTDNVNATTVNDCNRLFEELEGYSYTTEKYKQCEITLEDKSGEALFFIGGDFEFGDSITWTNPDADFDIEIGPVPAPDSTIE